MHVERNLLAVGRPVLVAEAVDISSVVAGLEGIVAGRDRRHLCLVGACRVGDLQVQTRSRSQLVRSSSGWYHAGPMETQPG